MTTTTAAPTTTPAPTTTKAPKPEKKAPKFDHSVKRQAVPTKGGSYAVSKEGTLDKIK